MANTTMASLTSITKIPHIHIPSDHLLLPNATTTHFSFSFTSKPKPIKTLSFKPHQLHYFHYPLLPRASFEHSSETQQEENEGEDEEEEEEIFNEDDNDENGTGYGEVGRLYVGNLPYAMTNSQLSEVFQEAGRVVSVEIVYDRVTDRSRGFAFVTMSSIEEAKEAIRMLDGSQVGGRTVKVNFPEVPRGGEREVMGPKIRSSNQAFVDSPHKIYAGNLSWNLTSLGLREAFFDQPGLLSVKVIYDRASGRSRGFGFITFSSAEAVESALNAMNGVELEGRPLRLNMAEQRAPTTSSPLDDSESNIQGDELLSSIRN